MKITYSKLTEKELDTFIQMRIRQLREEGAKEKIDLAPALKDYYERHMADGTFVSWLALDGEKIIGTSGMSFVEKPPYFGCPNGRIGLLSSMFTDPAYRRRGIAKELLRHAFEDIGMTKVWCGYYEGNTKSKRVQEKVGFRYQWRSEGVDVPLMHEKRTGHVSSITKDQWEWDRLYAAAAAVRNERRISDYVTCGEVSAAILSGSGKIYTGVCIDTCSTLGICAERNAIFNMITNGEQEIKKVIAILPDGSSGAPCGACRELMVQLMPEKYKGIEIMMDYRQEKIITLGELTPEWWIG